MFLEDLVLGSLVTSDGSQETLYSGSDYDWQNDNHTYSETQIREMSSWIKTNKEASTINVVIPTKNVDVSMFSDTQKHEYKHNKGTFRASLC